MQGANPCPPQLSFKEEVMVNREITMFVDNLNNRLQETFSDIEYIHTTNRGFAYVGEKPYKAETFINGFHKREGEEIPNEVYCDISTAIQLTRGLIDTIGAEYPEFLIRLFPSVEYYINQDQKPTFYIRTRIVLPVC
jgi:hypothetical protein